MALLRRFADLTFVSVTIDKRVFHGWVLSTIRKRNGTVINVIETVDGEMYMCDQNLPEEYTGVYHGSA